MFQLFSFHHKILLIITTTTTTYYLLLLLPLPTTTTTNTTTNTTTTTTLLLHYYCYYYYYYYYYYDDDDDYYYYLWSVTKDLQKQSQVTACFRSAGSRAAVFPEVPSCTAQGLPQVRNSRATLTCKLPCTIGTPSSKRHLSQNVCFGHKLPIKHTCKKATSSTAETGAHDLTHVCALTFAPQPRLPGPAH